MLCVLASWQSSDQWHCFLQEGRWNVLWLSGRFQTLVRMREDFPKGRVTSRSLKSTVFASHDGEWEASGICPLRCFIIPVIMQCFVDPLWCYSCAAVPTTCTVILQQYAPPADYAYAFPS